ncbi:hypothetical protein TWF281_006055 [Arthrobotrys megalospora]
MPAPDQTAASPLLSTQPQSTKSPTLVQTEPNTVPGTLGQSQSITIKSDSVTVSQTTTTVLFPSKDGDRNPNPTVDTPTAHLSKATIGPEFFFSGRMFVECFPQRIIFETLSPNRQAGIELGLDPDDFIDWAQRYDLDTAAGRKGARDNIRKRQNKCKQCSCTEGGLITPNYFDKACRSRRTALMCAFVYGCYCYKELGQPDPDASVPVEDYMGALSKLGLTEKHGNANWKWKHDPSEGSSLSAPSSSDPYRTKPELAPGTKEPYWLEGPDRHDVNWGTRMGYALNQLGQLGLDLAGGVGSIPGIWKRDAEDERVKTDQEEDCPDCPTEVRNV